MEGPRPMGHHQYARAIPYGNRKRDDEQSSALSVAAQSLGAMTMWGRQIRLQ
jgi:hypothetical protein